MIARERCYATAYAIAGRKLALLPTRLSSRDEACTKDGVDLNPVSSAKRRACHAVPPFTVCDREPSTSCQDIHTPCGVSDLRENRGALTNDIHASMTQRWPRVGHAQSKSPGSLWRYPDTRRGCDARASERRAPILIPLRERFDPSSIAQRPVSVPAPIEALGWYPALQNRGHIHRALR